MSEKILVTGCAGFIGMHTCKALLSRGVSIVGLDDLNDYYSVSLKKDRLKELECDRFCFHHSDVADKPVLQDIILKENITQVCHLAAQSGVRYSLSNPDAYIRSNIQGFVSLLEAVKDKELKNLVFASSSSVYGANAKIPFSVEDQTDKPVSLYGATKKSCELLAHAYHLLYGIKLTGLRFFTVYGPWGRPDMAYFKYALLIMAGKPIEVYNHGDMFRDFTYIDDIVAGILAALDRPFDFDIFNLGNSHSESLEDLIAIIEKNLGRKAEKIMLPIQPGDVKNTFADIEKSKQALGFQPKVGLDEGLGEFFKWFREYHGA